MKRAITTSRNIRSNNNSATSSKTNIGNGAALWNPRPRRNHQIQTEQQCVIAISTRHNHAMSAASYSATTTKAAVTSSLQSIAATAIGHNRARSLV